MTVAVTINVNTHNRSVVPMRQTPYFTRFTNCSLLQAPPTLIASGQEWG